MKKSNASPRSVLLVAGTRPEAIKLAMLCKELHRLAIPTRFCALGQHAELLDDALRCFEVEPDIVRKIMKPKQDLFHINTRSLLEAKKIFLKERPSLVIVQGDTTTAMASALAAFYLQIPVAHVEAGLRTPSVRRPFPEELNRRIITLVANLHFAPTEKAASRLLREGVAKNTVFSTGNTVVDALFWVREQIASGAIWVDSELFKTIAKQKQLQRKILLLTAHRRESFGGGLVSIFRAVRRALQERNDLFVLFPMHPNPAIREAFEKSGLSFAANLLQLPPLSYHNLVYAMDAADIVATDSGGIQEEAASLNKHVLVLRNETDRPEAHLVLAGTEEEAILRGVRQMMKREQLLDRGLPYGDGLASKRISLIIKDILK